MEKSPKNMVNQSFNVCNHFFFPCFLTHLAHSEEEDLVTVHAEQREEAMGTATEKAAPLYWDINWNV